MKTAGKCTKYIEQIKSLLTPERQNEFLQLLKNVRDKSITTPYDIAGTMFRIFKESESNQTALVCYEFHKLLPPEIAQEYINQFGNLYDTIGATTVECKKRKSHVLNEQWIENPKKLYQTKIYDTPPFKGPSNVAQPIREKSEKHATNPAIVSTPSTTSKTEEKVENTTDKIKVELCTTNDDSTKKMKESLKIDPKLLTDCKAEENTHKIVENNAQKSENKESKNEQVKNDNDEVKCVICYETDRKCNCFKKSKCGHIACDKCWQQWLSCCLECPICKARTRYKQLINY